jgi:hypothetical protein
MRAVAGSFRVWLTRGGRLALAGLAALFFTSGCGQGADGQDLGAALPTAPEAAPGVLLTPTSSFRPLGSDRQSIASACTHPAEYWQGHPAAWWHRELQMGATTYSKEEQLGILGRTAADNGLVGMGQQLIAARLNLATGVPDTGIDQLLTQADELIGAQVIPPRGDGWRPPADTAGIVEILAAFNEGRTGPGACK